MIQVVPECDFRERKEFSVVCNHPENQGKQVSVGDCVECPLFKSLQKPPDPPPGLMADGLFSAIGKVVSGVVGVAQAATGLNAPSLEVQKSRWEICHRCEQNWLGQCKSCGCFIAEKIRVASEKCPMPFNKWGPADAE